jgi:uncharacterized membrane protein YcaP (DUF421 family)
VTVYAFIMIAFSCEVGQLAPFDFALILLIANAEQSALMGSDTSLVGGLVAPFVLLAINFLLDCLAGRSRRVERFVRGRARLLVSRGRLDEEPLQEEGITHEDVMTRSR